MEKENRCICRNCNKEYDDILSATLCCFGKSKVKWDSHIGRRGSKRIIPMITIQFEKIQKV